MRTRVSTKVYFTRCEAYHKLDTAKETQAAPRYFQSPYETMLYDPGLQDAACLDTEMPNNNPMIQQAWHTDYIKGIPDHDYRSIFQFQANTMATSRPEVTWSANPPQMPSM
jgi:hypothetical protein